MNSGSGKRLDAANNDSSPSMESEPAAFTAKCATNADQQDVLKLQSAKEALDRLDYESAEQICTQVD